MSPADLPAPFYRDADYDPAVADLRRVLGFDHGERICRPHEIERYFEALAATGRASLVEYGRSVEGRPLFYLAISSAANLARVEEVKQHLRRLADPRVCSREEAARLIERTPAVTWVAANVHGGEHSSAEAAVLLGFHLLAGRDPCSRRIREETIVVIDPLQNPDGRERSVQYYYGAFGQGVNPNPNAAEHHSPWPGPRGNHYLFDLNRDWMLMTQTETLPKVRAFLEWRPQVYADLHEMGHNSSYYFFPPAPPIHAHYPEVTMRWWEAYGRAIAGWFDQYGFDYYTRERFDAFYPGYGESWPSFHGATGMTFEQAAARGLSIRRDDGVELTLREAIHHHFIAALATCDLTAAQREERLWDHYGFHEDGLRWGRERPVHAYLIPPQPGARRLADSLAAQGIEVSVTTESLEVRDAVDALTDGPVGAPLPAGTFLYSLEQPYSRYLEAVMEPRTTLPEGFLAEEIAHQQARLPNRFYDITAWSRPLALGLRMITAESVPAAPSQPLQEYPVIPARLPEAPVAFLLPDSHAVAPAVAARLLHQGYRVHCARRGFATTGREYPSGAFVIRRSGNQGVAGALSLALAEFPGELTIDGAATLWTDAGVDLGSEEVIYLKPPRLAVLYDWPVSSLSFGWLAYLLEARYRIPFTALRRDRLTAPEFRDFDVLVLPDGADYGKGLDAEAERALKAWVDAGGVLVGIGRAAAYLCRSGSEWVGARLVEDLRLAGTADPPPPDQSEGDRKPAVPHEFRPVRVPGAFVRVALDPHHPLTYGYQDPTVVFYEGEVLLVPGPDTHAVAAFAPAGGLEVSGFVWERMARALPGHLWAAEERRGRGHIVLFASDPAYRAAWDHMHRFLLNAFLLLPSVKRPA